MHGRNKLANLDAECDACREEFLRDGDKLAARMTGVLQLDGVETFYESFFFGRVDAGSGRLVSLIERAVWGAVGE